MSVGDWQGYRFWRRNEELENQINDILRNHPESLDWDACELLANKVVFQASKDAWFARKEPERVAAIKRQMEGASIWCDILNISPDSVVWKAVRYYTPYGERMKKKVRNK